MKANRDSCILWRPTLLDNPPRWPRSTGPEALSSYLFNTPYSSLSIIACTFLAATIYTSPSQPLSRFPFISESLGYQYIEDVGRCRRAQGSRRGCWLITLHRQCHVDPGLHGCQPSSMAFLDPQCRVSLGQVQGDGGLAVSRSCASLAADLLFGPLQYLLRHQSLGWLKGSHSQVALNVLDGLLTRTADCA